MKAVVWAAAVVFAIVSCHSESDGPERGDEDGGAAGVGAPSSDGAGAESIAGGEGGTAGETGNSAEAGGGGMPALCANADCGGAAASAAGAGSGADVGPISGTVFELEGVPAVGVAVVLNDAATSTDQQGHFSFPDPGPQYDLALISGYSAIVFEGLHGRTPTIQAPGPGVTKKGTLSGALTGAIGSSNQGSEMAFVVGRQALFNSQAGLARAGKSSYSINLSWDNADSISGKLLVLVFNNSPTGSFFAYGQQNATVGTAANPPAVDVGLATVTERTVDVNTSLPQDFHGNLRTLIGPFDFDCGDLPTHKSCTVPVGSTVPAAIRVTAVGPAGDILESSRSAPASGTLELTLPGAAAPILPGAAATGINSSTQFSWSTPSPGMVSKVEFSVPPYGVTVVTTATHATIPDLSKHGLNYLPKTAGSWMVKSFGPARTVDDVTEFVWTYDDLGGWSIPELDYTESAERSFTSAP